MVVSVDARHRRKPHTVFHKLHLFTEASLGNKKAWQRPTLPPLNGSTIGAAGLNFRVRDGNGWNPCAIVTRQYSHNQGTGAAEGGPVISIASQSILG